MTGLRPRRNIVDEDLAIWPRRRSSTTSVVPREIIHIQYTRRPSGLQTSRAAERRWIRIPIPAARRRAYGGEIPTKCSLQTRGVHSRKEKGGRERLEKLVSNRFILRKRAPYPSLYRPRRGAT